MLQKLNTKDFDKVYSLMQESFPPDERRTYEEQKALLNDQHYCIYTLQTPKAESIKAFIAIWRFNDFAFAEHFAVNPIYRNSGTGSAILREITKSLPCLLCLEVELPENELSKRRIDFYKRNGFFLNPYPYIQPPISNGRSPVPLMIMTYGCEVTEQKFKELKAVLYKYVYNASGDFSA